MRVLFINGSPHAKGCTWRSMVEIARVLHENGIENNWIHVGVTPVRGCMGCEACHKSGTGKCIYGDDVVNVAIARMAVSDAVIIGSPVHYGAPSGAAVSFLDRMFYASGGFAGKPGAAIVTCRRGGSTAALDKLNKYFLMNNMPVVPSSYWNMVHGNTIEEIEQDAEGLMVMRQLGNNLSWMLKSIEAGKKEDICFDDSHPVVRTNFIR